MFGKRERCEGEAVETGSFDQKEVVVGGRRVGRLGGRLGGGWRTRASGDRILLLF